MNGIPIWNWADTTSYNNQGVWHNSAIGFEWYDIDICLGHAAQGEYHRKCRVVVAMSMNINLLSICVTQITRILHV